ncbi:MAG TPA: winged helix DNA-binding domain-containing protein [Flavitalea sp.]|nr:winged helix DNA-binding domain-containing protein [Flavitalea sp.]
MNSETIIAHRLINQCLLQNSHANTEDVVRHMIAIQSQEFGPARWAISIRGHNLSDNSILDAFNSGEILRTHLLRPTWHFVAKADIRWVIHLTAPHVIYRNKYYYKQAGLDARVFTKSNKVLSKCLRDQTFLTRKEIGQELSKNKIRVTGIGLGYIMMNAELESIICSGPRKGNQFTYALIDELVAPQKPIERNEALVKLFNQYIISRGPASLADFCYWSGLSAADANKALKMSAINLSVCEYQHHKLYYAPDMIVSDRKASAIIRSGKSKTTILLPDYDEYLMSYKDKSLLTTEGSSAGKNATNYNRMIIEKGRIIGSWRRAQTENDITVELREGIKFTDESKARLQEAENRYRKFISR